MYRILLPILLLTSLFAYGNTLDTLRIKTEADSLFTIADSLRQAWELDEALELYQGALGNYQQIADMGNEARALKEVGLVYYYLGNLNKALPFFENQLTLLRKLYDHLEEGKTISNIGVIYRNLGNYPKALEYFQNSLDIRIEINDRLGESYTLYNIGCVYEVLSDYPKAQEFFDKSLDIAIEVSDTRCKGNAFEGLGSIYSDLSEYPKALEYFEKSLEMAKVLDDRNFEGEILSNIGTIYYFQSDFQKALKYFIKSLEIKKGVGDRLNEANTLNQIGLVYISLSDYQKALSYFEVSLDIARDEGYQTVEGFVISNIGGVYWQLSNYAKALEYMEEDLRRTREIDDHRGEGQTLNNIGLVYISLSDYQKALEFFEQSLEIAIRFGARRSECQSLGNIGLVYTMQHKYTEAEEFLKGALVIAQEIKSDDIIQEKYLNLGNLYASQNLDSLAVESYVISIDIIENIRGKLDVEGQKTSYSAGVSGIYEKIVLSYLKLNRNEVAFNYMERSRARSFLDLLASGDVKVGKSSHEEFLKKEAKFHEKEEDLEEGLIEAEEDTVLFAELRGKMEEQRGLMIREMEEKKKYEPELASLVTVNSLTLPQVQALLDKETVLEYFLTKEKTLIWLINKDHAEVFLVNVGGDSLQAMVESFRSAIKNLLDSEGQSSKLYDLLIKPAVNKIKTEELVIIPHGILHYLPFQALQNEKGKYMLEKYQISYLPSASVMKYIIPKKRVKGKTILALGNPKLDKTSFAPISFAEQEVKAISKQYRKSKMLIGADATEENFRKLAPKYDILHLACHAEMNSTYPLYSGLLLSSSEKQDGELDVHELFSLDLNAYLVVLSACQTGLGHLTNGDELVGLSRAFIYAGTPSIISSLWMVEDESTSYLMEKFYKNLNKYNKAESLRKAQLETKKKYKNLRSWSSFVLVGES